MERKGFRSQHKSSSTAKLADLSLDIAVEHELKHGSNLDPNMDRRKFRRTLSNRLSAQRSRTRKCQYVKNMEKIVQDLEELVSVITPQIDNFKETNALLLQQNESLQEHVERRTNELKLAEIEIEQKQAEVCRLRELERSANYDDYYPYNLELKIGSSSSSSKDERLGFPFKFPFEKSPTSNINQEEADVDQYINFEQLNLDQGSG